MEWTTETATDNNTDYPCVYRGGFYILDTRWSATRANAPGYGNNGETGFRSIIYMNSMPVVL